MSGELLLWGAVLLACPLMMMWMMQGGGAGRGDETAELKQRIADLEAERDRNREEAGG